MQTLQELLSSIALYSTQGQRKELTKILRLFKNDLRNYYFQSIQKNVTAEYSDALYKMLLLELEEDEEEGIEMAELAYLSITESIEKEIIAAYKHRLMLVHYFCDYFTDSIIEIFLPQHRAENILQARSMAVECLEKMQWADMLKLEEYAPELIENDEQLIDACNSMENIVNLTESDTRDALVLHQVLSAYLKNKYKN